MLRLLLAALFLPASLRAQSAAQAVVAEFDRLSALPLWPGFAPAATPLAIYDGDSTWLIRHPAPPAEFAPVAGWPNARVTPGQHPAVRANSNVRIGDVPTATLLLPREPEGPDWTRIAGTMIHEAFHGYQARFARWQGNEVEFFTYPVTDTVLQRLQRLETEAWRRATLEPGRQACWAREALRLRRARFAALSPGAVGYERGNELNESLATWVQTRATRAPVESLVPVSGFAPDGVRLRAYSVGPVLAFLLDRFAPGWPARLETDSTAFLETLLEPALPKRACGVAFTRREQDSVAALAAREVAALVSRRETARRACDERSGWTLVLQAAPDKPLWPQGFDPWNVTPLDRHATLHQRWLKLGNEAGHVEVLNRTALTVGVGEHPLFTGVERLWVTGLDSLPQVRADGASTILEAPGVSARFEAVVDTAEKVMRLRLRR
jgi:hypothetical protein